MADLTLTEWFGVLGFILAILSLIWQGAAWFLETRVRLKVSLFRNKYDPIIIVAECVNVSRQRTVQIRMVWIQWGKGKNDGLELQEWERRPQDGRIEPGIMFQTRAAIQVLQTNGMPKPPASARAMVKIAGHRRTYRSRPFRIE